MPINYVQLKSELNTDPNAYGYAPFIASGADQNLADMLNLPRAAIVMPRPDVNPLEVLEAINVADFVAANAQTILMGSWLESLTQFQQIRILKENGSDTRVMTNLMRFLVNGSQSEVRLRALASRAGSRAEQLFGVGTTVAHMDIAQALRATP
jgi:hypothetical protein